MCACWGQVALRGLSGFLSLEQIWIILPPGEKEIYLEVMAAIPKAKYWFKPNDIYFWTLTQNSDWANASFFWAPTRANDYWLRLLPSSALPVSLSLSTTWNHTTRKIVQALGLLSVSHISSVATSSCYDYLSGKWAPWQLWQPVRSNLSLLNVSFPIWPLMFKLPIVALVTFLCLLLNVKLCVDLI